VLFLLGALGAFMSYASQTMAQQIHRVAARYHEVLRAHDKELLAIPGVVGVYVAGP